MKRIFLVISIMASIVGLQVGAGAEGVEALREMCAPGSTLVLEGPLTVSGVVVCDCRSKNMELNPNITYAKVDLSLSDRTAYIQSPDGSAGVRLVFDDASANTLHFADKVTLDLAGCLLEHEVNPDRVTVRHLGSTSVLERLSGGICQRTDGFGHLYVRHIDRYGNGVQRWLLHRYL